MPGSFEGRSSEFQEPRVGWCHLLLRHQSLNNLAIQLLTPASKRSNGNDALTCVVETSGYVRGSRQKPLVISYRIFLGSVKWTSGLFVFHQGQNPAVLFRQELIFSEHQLRANKMVENYFAVCSAEPCSPTAALQMHPMYLEYTFLEQDLRRTGSCSGSWVIEIEWVRQLLWSVESWDASSRILAGKLYLLLPGVSNDHHNESKTLHAFGISKTEVISLNKLEN